MMNQLFRFPGRGNSCGGGCDRAPFRSRTGRGMAPGQGSCGCSGGRLPTNRDMNPAAASRSCGCSAPAPETPTRPSCGCPSPGPSSTPVPCRKRCATDRPADETPSRGCGCGASRPTPRPGDTPAMPSAECRKLMEQIRSVDFALWETILYLDAYPNSCDALTTYHKLLAESEQLHQAYEASYGPLTAFGNQSTTSWEWMRKPFPWEYDAN